MRLLIQRLGEAWVTWDDTATAKVEGGLLVLVGFRHGDGTGLLEPMAEKLVHLRIFEDEAGRMNFSLLDRKGALVVVPQFTLYADCRKGRRPGFSGALAPNEARLMFDEFVECCRQRVERIEIGSFGAEMQVHLVNDGPVTILLDSAELNLTC